MFMSHLDCGIITVDKDLGIVWLLRTVMILASCLVDLWICGFYFRFWLWTAPGGATRSSCELMGLIVCTVICVLFSVLFLWIFSLQFIPCREHQIYNLFMLLFTLSSIKLLSLPYSFSSVVIFKLSYANEQPWSSCKLTLSVWTPPRNTTTLQNWHQFPLGQLVNTPASKSLTFHPHPKSLSLFSSPN